MMRAIDKKLWRELWNLRMQVLAIALVIVGGVSVFIMSLTTLDSLFDTRERYYREYHFAEVFASLKRAPLALKRRIEAIPGVDKVETRVVAYVSIDVPGFDEPVSAHLLSLPANSPGLLNQVYLRNGRLLESGRDHEVVVSAKFAEAHDLGSGESLFATINGRRKKLTVVGHAMSPEYVYQIAPGAMFPDHSRYGVMWMARAPLATAYDMDGAFNDVSLTLVRGTNEQDVIDRLDEILKPYGGIGAYTREDQLSSRFLDEDLKQQKTTATVFPVIFFGVAAFMLNIVFSRLISLQREQIAALKAFGYSNAAVGLHYAKLVMLITGLGVVVGIGAGIWMGQALSRVFMEFYSFPFMSFVLKPAVLASAVLIALVAAVAGTLYAVGNAIRLPPAEAMRPEPPDVYRATLIERLGLQRLFSQPSRMILRHLERRPLKTLLTTFGIAMAGGIMVVTGFQESAIDYMIDLQYGVSHRADMVVHYNEPTSARSLYSLLGLRGVEQVEGVREIPARLHFGHRSYRGSLQGIPADSHLLRLFDNDLNRIRIPADGIVLTDHLAEVLQIGPGDQLTVEVLEGDRRILSVPVVATAKQHLGMNAYLEREALNRLLREGSAVSSALLRIDQRYRRQLDRELKDMPRIAGVVEQQAAVDAFYDNISQTLLFYTFISTILGASIAFGVVYNSMRIALSERGRELASLRVLGFERSEVAYILLGEMGLLTLVAIPLGLLAGYGLSAYLSVAFDSDLYRVPLVIGIEVYALAALVVVVSTVLSAALIWRSLARLDMVAVLKTRE